MDAELIPEIVGNLHYFLRRDPSEKTSSQNIMECAKCGLILSREDVAARIYKGEACPGKEKYANSR